MGAHKRTQCTPPRTYSMVSLSQSVFLRIPEIQAPSLMHHLQGVGAIKGDKKTRNLSLEGGFRMAVCPQKNHVHFPNAQS